MYGRPTDLPWALEIDEQHLNTALYAVGTTFHPTFLYESLWSLALCGLLLLIDRRFRPAPGQLFVMYVIGYGIGRFWVEGLRIDRADEIAGLRFNQWVAAIAVVGGAVLLAWMRRHPIPEPTITDTGEVDTADFDEAADADTDTGEAADTETAAEADTDEAAEADTDEAAERSAGETSA